MPPYRCGLSLFFIVIQLLGFVPAAPSDNSMENPNRIFAFDIMMDQSDHLPAELQLKLLQEEREQEGE